MRYLLSMTYSPVRVLLLHIGHGIFDNVSWDGSDILPDPSPRRARLVRAPDLRGCDRINGAHALSLGAATDAYDFDGQGDREGTG